MKKLACAFAIFFSFCSVNDASGQLEGPAVLETPIMEDFDQALLPNGGPIVIGQGGPGEGSMPLPGPLAGGPVSDMPPDVLAHGGPFLIRSGGAGPLPADFSDEQLERIYKTRQSFQEKTAPKMLELRNLGRALRDGMMEPEVDRAKLQAIQNKMNALTAELGSLKLEQQLSVLSVFTPEQRKEMRRAFLQRSVGGRGPCPPAACGPGGGHFQRKIIERRGN